MKSTKALTIDQLRGIVDRIQGLLYLDLDEAGREVWNPDKAWSPDTLEEIAQCLTENQLVPTKVTPWTEPADSPA